MDHSSNNDNGAVDLGETNSSNTGIEPSGMTASEESRRRPSSRKGSRLSIVEVRPTTERLRVSMMVEPKGERPAAGGHKLGSKATGEPEEGTDRSGRLQESGGRKRGEPAVLPDMKGKAPWYQRAANQVPAVALVALFHLMVGIPFGVSYFPVGWRDFADGDTSLGANNRSGNDEDRIEGPFPLQGKEALGIRMFLFSTIVGQLVFTFASKFTSACGLQMVENVPFCHSLASIVIKDQGYGLEALSTLFFLFALASVIVGIVFYFLGKLELGRIVYFFPSHVLVGCIGGIGVFLAKTGLEVTTDTTLSFNVEGLHNFIGNLHLLSVVFLFEITLRLLDRITQDEHGLPRYPLLSPIYFIMITPVFYVGLWMFRVDVEDAEEAGYFFPPLDVCNPEAGSTCEEKSIFKDLWNIWRIVNVSTISWGAVFNSIPTLVALVLFSLIHVPINIPAFGVTTGADVDMNAELIAHGYSNTVAGMFGGLQNYMAYTQSVIYFKSGGVGKASSLAVALVTSALFVVGPTIASYMPRCMAGTLLLHVGIDLFLEGVYDSYGKYDYLEYAGVWLITIVMTAYGMEAALVAGVIAALSTYAFQSITYPNPIRGTMSAATLRSSRWHRRPEADAVLNSDVHGRKRIFVVQLQGHLFFGNVAQFTDSIKKSLTEKQGTTEEAWIVILDFSLVLGIDSSAAQAVTKLKDTFHKTYDIDHCVFVTGSTVGFPCEYPLSQELLDSDGADLSDCLSDNEDHCCRSEQNETTNLLQLPNGSAERGQEQSLCYVSSGHHCAAKTKIRLPRNHVCGNLDSALLFAEDALVAREDPTLLDNDSGSSPLKSDKGAQKGCSLQEEREFVLQLLHRLCASENMDEVGHLFSLFKREVYYKHDILWRQGSSSDCAKLLVRGSLISLLENEAGTSENIQIGNMIGESGLVQRTERMSTVKCLSDEAVLYSLSLQSWEILERENPNVARFVYAIVVRYLAHRVQHVSNRIFETRCLPI